jgi:hypothetical protein
MPFLPLEESMKYYAWPQQAPPRGNRCSATSFHHLPAVSLPAAETYR